MANRRRAAGGRYILGELLGRGGMAEVFAGRALGSLGFQKPVAIKRLLPSLAQDDEYVGRLVDEAKLLVGLSHANVISVLDLVRESDDVFLVMEFVDGPSLRQLLGAHARTQRGPLPLGLVTYIIHAACAGLEYAHARPTGAIIHADVSPSNLLLTTTGEVKVADFGIARREGIVTAIEGKWAYMPPEQASGAPLSNRSDEFALGVCLYELLTGVHPFARRVTEHGRDEAALSHVRPPRELRPEIPPALEAACLRAMAPEPAQRFPRLAHLADALSEVRFQMGWRDGAPELAAMICELAGVARPTPPDAMQLMARASAGRTQVTTQPVTIITRSLIAAGDTDAQLRALTAEAGALGATTPHAWTINRKQAARRQRSWMLGSAILGSAVLAGAVVAVLIAQAGDHAVDPGLAAPPVAAALAPASAPPSVAAAPALAPDLPRPDAARLTDALPAPPPAAPAPAPAPAPAAARTRAAPASPAPARARTARLEPRPAAPAGDVGLLSVNAVPWAYVTVDGRRQLTPATLRLAPGSYTLTFDNPDLGAKTTRFVTVKAGDNRPVRVRFER